MSVRLSSSSNEYVKVPVQAKHGTGYVDPTFATISFGYTATTATTPTTWVAGTWETVDGHYFAEVLVGPSGTLTVPAGTWALWLRVVDDTETPIRFAGTLVIT